MHAAVRIRLKPKDIRAELPALLHLAIPLIAGELGWVAMSVIDTIMVGRLDHSAVNMAAAALAQVIFNTLAFGIGGIGAALLGAMADVRGIEFVYRMCAYLPLLGVAAAFLPNLGLKARTSGR